MELENFYKNVIPVSEYFDQSGLLSVVNGERNPGEVYKDFRSAVFEVLGSQDNQNALMNGVVGMGRGVTEIPGTIVTIESTNTNLNSSTTLRSNNTIDGETSSTPNPSSPIAVDTNPLNPINLLQQPQTANNNVDFSNLPPVIWVIIYSVN